MNKDQETKNKQDKDNKPAQQKAINMRLVEELESLLKHRRTTEARFRFNLSTEEAVALFTACYKLEVERRLRKFLLDDNTRQNLTSLSEYITSPNPRFGVMLCGTCGNGKSTLMYAFQRALNFLADKNHFEFMGHYFMPGMTIYDAYELVQIARDVKEFNRIKNKSMIGIDDLGNEPVEILEFGNPIHPIIRLIEYRYVNQSFTFITTNLTAKDIRSKYGVRIADRFNEMLHVIVFNDGSYRKDTE